MKRRFDQTFLFGGDSGYAQMPTPTDHSKETQVETERVNNQENRNILQLEKRRNHTKIASSKVSTHVAPPTPIDVFKCSDLRPTIETAYPIPNNRLQAMLEKESDHLPSNCQMVTSSTRTYSVKLMLKLCKGQRYHSETFFMSVVLFDRYCSQVKIRQRKIILRLAVTCVYICAKLAEETNEPKIRNFFRYVEEFEYTAKEIKDMERKVVKILNWNLSCVTPFAIFHELVISLGFTDPRIQNFDICDGLAVLEQKLCVVFGALLVKYEISTVPASYLLRAVLEFLNNISSLVKVGIDIKEVEAILPVEPDVLLGLNKILLRLY